MRAYIARDKNGEVYLHREKPTRLVNGVFASDDWWILERCDFPNVTYENSPVEVEIIEKSTLDEVYKGLDQYEEFLGVVANMRELQKEQMTADIRWENLEYYKERDRMMFELEQMVDKWLEGEAL